MKRHLISTGLWAIKRTKQTWVDDLSPEAFCTGTVKTDSYMACLLATRLALNLRGLKHRYPEAFLVTPPAE